MTDHHNSIFHTPEKVSKLMENLVDCSTEAHDKNNHFHIPSKVIGSAPDLKSKYWFIQIASVLLVPFISAIPWKIFVKAKDTQSLIDTFLVVNYLKKTLSSKIKMTKMK